MISVSTRCILSFSGVNYLFSSHFQLHGEMYKKLAAIYGQVMSIFPSLEAARPRSKTGIQALCSLHVALEKAKNTLRHCSESSKLYLVWLDNYHYSNNSLIQLLVLITRNSQLMYKTIMLYFLFLCLSHYGCPVYGFAFV